MDNKPSRGDGSPDDPLVHDAIDATDSVQPSETETVKETLPATSLPKRIGPYSIKRAIASGGMGTVYEAVQEKPRRTVAVKVMRQGIASRSALRRFDYEAQLLARLRHPGIAQVYDAGTHRDGEVVVPYFAMEYIVKARPITTYVKQKKLGTRERLKLFAEVCEAVHHGHQKGIIHRDLKPSNILVDSSGQVKIIDFGVARSTDSDMAVTTLQTDVGQLIGTLQYMSPEQCDADPHDIDTRSDVYALGVILYEMLCERLPYEIKGAAIHEATRVVREQEPTRLSTHNKTLRGDVETIALKALEKDRDRRYQSASALVADIGRYLKNEAISARPASAMYQLRKLVSRHKVPFAFVGALFLLISAFGVWMSVMYAQANHLRQEAVAAAEAQAVARQEAEEARSAEEEQRKLAQQREADALAARASEEEQRKLAEERAEELKTVTEFQQSMLSDIDAEAMGRGIVEAQREDIRARMTGEGADAAAVEAALASFADLVGKTNPTNLALKVVDEHVLARAVETIDKEFADQPVTAAAMRQTVADTYHTIGLYDAAMPLQEAALATYRKELGDDHPDTLASTNNMGYLLRQMGRYADAKSYYREALEGFRRVLGDDHPDTLASINSMGYLLRQMGRYADAKSYYREALEGFRRVLGDDHPDTLASINNMGTLLDAQGKLDEAEPYYREALEGKRRVLGDDHPSTLTSINNMGYLLQAQGKLDEAEPYYREALESKRRVLGDDHPSTLTSINNMGYLLQAQGKLDEAEPYYREALESERRVQGDDHPDTLISINNMGLLLQAQGKLDEAEPYWREALEGCRRVLGDDHPHTLISINNMGWLLKSQGKLGEAEPYFREALEARRRVLSDDHPDTLTSINSMGHLLKAQGKLDEAEPYWREALEGCRRVLGDDHPNTLTAINNMANLLNELGRHDEAAEVLLAGEAAARRAWAGDNAKWLGNYLAKLGEAQTGLDQFSESETTLLEAHALLAAGFGDDHARTTKTIERMVALYDAWDAAEPDTGYDAKAAEWRAKLSANDQKESN